MRNPFAPPILRLRVPTDDPRAGPRPNKSRRPHSDAKVAAVRKLIEQTTLTYGEIESRTGVGRASICRWTRDGQWQRPLFAPRATDTVPRERASARLRRRTLAARLSALAERYVRELEAVPGIDLDKLGCALELMKLAKLAARPRKRVRGRMMQATEEPAHLLARLRAEGVNFDRAPESAVKDFVESHREPRNDPALRPRGLRSRRVREHRRMLENQG
jgi:hypothetical protein